MILTIVTFVLILGLIVVVHELGHFFAARKNGVGVDEFGLGLPPRIIGMYRDNAGKWKTIGPATKQTPKTIWSLNWIPLGGFVKIKGEEGGASNDPDSFVNKSVWRRIWIISAGVTMNIILAAVLLTIGFMVGSPQFIEPGQLPSSARVTNQAIRVVQVLPGSPAAKAGITVADTVVAVDQQPFADIKNLQDYINAKTGTAITVSIKRDTQALSLSVVPEVLSETGRGGLGVGLAETGLVAYPWYTAWIYGIQKTFVMMWSVLYGFYAIIQSLFSSGHLVGEVYGPVGIASLVGDAARMGFLYVLQFTAALSVIIAVVNFLPFPALDGGRAFFLVIEAIRKKPINQRFEAALHNAGFALLMLLVLVVTFNDIGRMTGGFSTLWQNILRLF